MREAEFEKRFLSGEATLDESWQRYFATEGPFDAWAALKGRLDWLATRAQGPLVLDVGCGSGVLGHIASLWPTVEHVAALDLHPGAVELARENCGPRVAVIQGWAEALPFAAGTFQTVMMGETLEHVLNPTEALAEARRVLVPGGRLIASVPDNGPPTVEHRRCFTRDQFLALVEMAGFRVDEFKRIAHWLCLVAHRMEGASTP